MMSIITAKEEIGKRFYENGFGKILSRESVPQNRLAEIISGLCLKGIRVGQQILRNWGLDIEQPTDTFCPRENGTNKQ